MNLEQLAEFFDAPLDWPVNPDAAAANERAAQWARDTAMATSPQEAEFYRLSHFGEAVGVSYPRARGEGLQFAVDWTTYAFFADETLTALTDNPAHVAAVIDSSVEVLCTPPGHLARPLRGAERGLADLVERAQRRMSPAWNCRFQRSVKDWWTGSLLKSLAVADGNKFTCDQCLHIRRFDIGMQPPIDMIELFEGIELPEAVHATDEMRRLRTIILEAIAIQNDVCSLPKERAQWDLNLILVLEQTHGLTTAQALQHAQQIYRARVSEFAEVKDRLSHQCKLMQFTPNQLDHVDLVVDDMHTLFSGVCHAHLVSARYLPDLHLAPSKTGPGFMHEFDDIAITPARTRL